MKYQVVLFDIDGTLVDSYPPYVKIMRAVLPKFHRAITDQQLRKTFPMVAPMTLKYLKIPQSNLGQFETDYYQAQDQLVKKPTLFPGIQKMFRGLERKLFPALGIVTSGGPDEIKALSRNYSFMKKVWVTVDADSTPYHKPAPDPLLYAIDQMGLKAKDTLYIGDAISDEKAAHNAKMAFGAAGWGADPNLKFKKAQYYFKKPEEILKLR